MKYLKLLPKYSPTAPTDESVEIAYLFIFTQQTKKNPRYETHKENKKHNTTTKHSSVTDKHSR